MDSDNLADLGGVSARVRLFRDFDPVGTGGDVPDPYYGGDAGFEEVLTMVERTSASLARPARRRRRRHLGGGPMTRQPLVARHAEELLGSAVVATAPVNGGDVCVATKLRLSDGTTALMKTLNNAPAAVLRQRGRRAGVAAPRPAASACPRCWPPTTAA